MIHSLTGTKPGERYAVEHLDHSHDFPGFFLDGKYYLEPELMKTDGARLKLNKVRYHASVDSTSSAARYCWVDACMRSIVDARSGTVSN